MNHSHTAFIPASQSESSLYVVKKPGSAHHTQRHLLSLDSEEEITQSVDNSSVFYESSHNLSNNQLNNKSKLLFSYS